MPWTTRPSPTAITSQMLLPLFHSCGLSLIGWFRRCTQALVDLVGYRGPRDEANR